VLVPTKLILGSSKPRDGTSCAENAYAWRSHYEDEICFAFQQIQI
jgi:hypothetical protein